MWGLGFRVWGLGIASDPRGKPPKVLAQGDLFGLEFRVHGPAVEQGQYPFKGFRYFLRILVYLVIYDSG